MDNNSFSPIDHDPCDSPFAPITGGQVPENYSPFSPIDERSPAALALDAYIELCRLTEEAAITRLVQTARS